MISKKSQFYFLFTILIISIVLYFVKSFLSSEIDNFYFYKQNFESELPYAINYALFNNYNVFNSLQEYVQNFKSFMNLFLNNAYILFFFYYKNQTLIWSDLSIKLFLPNGSVIDLNIDNPVTIVNFDTFQYEFEGKLYNVKLNKDFDYIVNMRIS